MKNSLYFIAGILVVAWFFIVINFKTDSIVHILLVAAFFVVLLRIFNKKRYVRD